MIAKLVMLKGLPASGKTTLARKLVAQGYVRVNKDDLRDMLHNGIWSKDNEAQVIHIRDAIISNSLFMGKNVVVDDTNLNPAHQETFERIARKYAADFEVNELDTPIEECIRRDRTREKPVGETVIREMAKKDG